VGWFPWRNLHHSLVNVEQRRAKLEAYLGMLFTHNQAMQSHPLTLSFFSRSGAADIQMGVIVPPPIKPLSAYNAMQQASESAVTARSVVSTSKRLVSTLCLYVYSYTALLREAFFPLSFLLFICE
jgi:hypothetical protein